MYKLQPWLKIYR